MDEDVSEFEIGAVTMEKRKSKKHGMTYGERLAMYEKEKMDIVPYKLTADEYEREIKTLAEKWRI